MKKIIYLVLFCLLINNNCFSQKKNITNTKTDTVHQLRAFMSLKDYSKRYNRKVTENDIKNFIYKDRDTLILISDKDFYKKGISVPYQPKDSSFLETYKDVIYQKYSSRAKNPDRKNYMRLWRTPIKIYFAKSLDIEYKNAIIKTANMLSKEIDSLNITIVDELEKSNYIIYQVDDKNSYRFIKQISSNKYIDYYLYWKSNKIYDAMLELNLTNYKTESKNTNINHLIQNFFKTLGRFYESSKIPYGSILSNITSSRKEISKLDMEILKYHYSFGICKGTDLETFEEQHIKAKEIFKKTGRHLQFTHIDD